MVMYGSMGVGKSTLTIRMITDNFLDEYDPTIEDSYRKQMIINEQPIVIDVLDTAGKEEFTAMQDQWLREGKVFLICFSITSRDSWNDVELYRKRLFTTRVDKDWAMILVSTKGDLEKYRAVSREEILERVHAWNIPFVETSAKDKKNVDFVYQQAIYSYWIASQTDCCMNIDR